MKSGVTNTLKFKRLKRLLKQPDCMVAGVLEMLWGLAVDQARMGDVGRFTNEEIATAIDWPGDADHLIDSLADSGWLDRNYVCRLLVHDWIHHAPQFVTRWIARELGVAPAKVVYSWLAKFGIEQTDGYSQLANGDESGDSFSQNGVGDLPHGRGSIPTQPNPPPPIPSPATQGGDSPRSAAWRGVEEDLLKCGVSAAGKAIDEAIANKCRPEDVTAVVAYWRCSRGKWQAGALYRRILNMRPGQDHTELWPEPSAEFVESERRAKSVKSQAVAASSRGAAERQRAEDEKQLLEREAKFGAAVDALSADQIRKLILETFPDESELMLRRFRGELPVSGLIRESILSYLAVAPKGPTAVLESL